MKIDINKCANAMQSLVVQGDVTDNKVRQKAIEDAITAIQSDPKQALSSEYIGVKNYASFGDQREDHRYGMGPRHGSIVFRIERVHAKRDVELGSDHIYFLECIRDFGVFEEDGEKLNLCDVLARFDKAHQDYKSYLMLLESSDVSPTV